MRAEYSMDVVDYFTDESTAKEDVFCNYGSDTKPIRSSLQPQTAGGVSWNLTAGKPVLAKSSDSLCLKTAHPANLAIKNLKVAQCFELCSEERDM
ncbi:hypothetical protein IF1G_09600 [Cordyceps javanica]|uniref:Uncharacterized protein n=1 Tax=Cordyceps javanica TaxID=43265 RepID=A0A545UPY8_9HYPO|nr:hypothetical protein IF1G_09600 [Cordyceps javanica]TQW03683.1 hypothetical protein IF2G_08981 [Cordyceps javanica]